MSYLEDVVTRFKSEGAFYEDVVYGSQLYGMTGLSSVGFITIKVAGRSGWLLNNEAKFVAFLYTYYLQHFSEEDLEYVDSLGASVSALLVNQMLGE